MSPETDTQRTPELQYSQVLINLFKGVVYRDVEPRLWDALVDLQSRVRDYVAVLDLELVLDEAEGHAYLRQRARSEDRPELPRLVRRRQLSYPVSLLLALIRKKLVEHDAGGGDPRLILSREQIVDLVRLFLPDTANEAKLLDRIDAQVNKVVELGFLRRLRGQDDHFEVRRIIASFVDAQWLAEFDRRLAAYAAYLADPGADGNEGP
ncbi:MAG: DUF4194 domain-containing protein [Halothiobacillaceae bacterium]